MQMINVLQRLAELDANNPNVVYDKKQGVAEGYSTLDLWNMSPKEVIELLDANKITYDDFRAYQDLVIQGGPDADDDFDYTDHSMRKGEQGVAEGSGEDDDYSSASFEKWKKQKEYEKEYDKKKPAKPVVPNNKDKKQGVAEGSDNIRSMIQQYEDMVELVYDLPPGQKKNIAINKRDALEAQIEAMPGGSEALRQWAKLYNDAMDEGVAEGAEQSVEECGMMGSMDRPSTPASINMTAATGEELGHMLKDIMSLAGVSKSEAEPLSTTPSIGLASRDGMDMKSMIDKLNDMETVETIDSMPNDPIPTEPFDAEQHAHHENPPGADRKGNANNPRAYDTNESAVERLMAEYKSFISEDSK